MMPSQDKDLKNKKYELYNNKDKLPTHKEMKFTCRADFNWRYDKGFYPKFAIYDPLVHGKEPPSKWIERGVLKHYPEYLQTIAGMGNPDGDASDDDIVAEDL